MRKTILLTSLIFLITAFPGRASLGQLIENNLGNKPARIGQLVVFTVKDLPEAAKVSEWKCFPETENFVSKSDLAAFSGEIPGKYSFFLAYYANDKVEILSSEIVVAGIPPEPDPQNALDIFFQQELPVLSDKLERVDLLKLSLIFSFSDGDTPQGIIDSTYNKINDEFDGEKLDAIAVFLNNLNSKVLVSMNLSTKEDVLGLWKRISKELEEIQNG